MEITIICATIDFLEEYEETLDHPNDELKETIRYWKNEANRAETRVSQPSEPTFGQWIEATNKPPQLIDILFYDEKTKRIHLGVYYECEDDKGNKMDNWQAHLNNSFMCYLLNVTKWMPLPKP